MTREVDWRLVEQLDQRVSQFVGLGATDAQIRRLLDNWHIVSALASGRLESVFEEFIPVHPEKTCADVDWSVWQEKLRHFPVRIDHGTSLKERVIRTGIVTASDAARPFLDVPVRETHVETLRLKIIRNTRSVTDTELGAMLTAKLLEPTRLAPLLEFVSQHPECVPSCLYATASRQYVEGQEGERIILPCIRKVAFDDGSYQRVTLTTSGFPERQGGVVYPANQTFLVIRRPLPRDDKGNLLPPA